MAEAARPGEPATILTAESDRILEVTLNRPEVRNAFDATLISELTAAVNGAAERRVRAIVLRGAGPVFSAGADLNWMARAAAFSYEVNLADARTAQQMFAALAAFPGVTIAVVHGAAIGGGAGLAAVCDYTIADVSAVFALSEVRLGLVPAVIAPYVIEKIGPGAARALFLTGERFGAARAYELGLVQAIGETEAQRYELLASTLARVLEAGPEAVATAKRLIREVTGRPPDQVAAITTECIAALRVSAEGQEGVHAFLEKRKPRFASSTDPATGQGG